MCIYFFVGLIGVCLFNEELNVYFICYVMKLYIRRSVYEFRKFFEVFLGLVVNCFIIDFVWNFLIFFFIVD